jgi:phenylacetate-coenzyme A ligase PaaK-like adenylate-forming protein
LSELRASRDFAAPTLLEYLLLLEVRDAGLARLARFHEAWRPRPRRRPRPHPLLSKAELRTNFQSLVTDELCKGPVWWKTTSGTSGRPVDIPYDATFYLDFKYGVFHKAWYMRHGAPLGDRPYLALVVTDLADEPASLCVDPLYSAGLVARLSIDVSNAQEIDQVLRLIDRHRPDILSTKPAVLMALAQAAAGRSPASPMVIVGGAALAPEARVAAAPWIGANLISIYATSEVGVIASECSEGKLHVYESDVEVTDSHPDAPAEIVVTNRTNRALPLTGYRTGDIGRIAAGACGCGHRWRWIDRLEGRVVPLFHFSRDIVFSPTRYNSFLRKFPSARDFQVSLHGTEFLEVKVEHLEPPDNETVERMSAFFADPLPPGVTVGLSAHRFDPHEKFARYRVVG